MTVTYRGGTSNVGTTSATPSAHASAAAEDLTLAFVGCRAGTGTVATPAGWSKLQEMQASGGEERLYVFSVVGVTAGSTVTFTGTGTTTIVAVLLCFQPGASEIWDVASTIGEDSSSGTGVSVTGAAGLGVASGDWVVTGLGANANTTMGSSTISGMAGATLSATTARTANGTATGSALRVFTYSADVTAGSSSAAPVYTATAGTSVVAVAGFVRIRALVPDTGVESSPGRAWATSAPTQSRAGQGVTPPTAAAYARGAGARVENQLGIRHAPKPAAARASGAAPVLRAGHVVSSRPGGARASAWQVTQVTQPLPPAPPWQVTIRSQAWADLMAQSRRMTSVRVDLIDESGQVVARFGGANVTSLDGEITDATAVPVRQGVAGWQVQAVAGDPVMRTCSLDLTDPSFVPRPGSVTDLFHPLGRRRARIWHLTWDGGQWVPVLLGTFHLDAPSIDGDGMMSVQGFDSVGLIKRARWVTPLSLGGLACHRAIQRVLTARAPWVKQSITPTTAVLPASYEVGAPGDDPWDDVERIQAAAGLIVHADREGVIVGEPWAQDRAVVADWTEGDGCTMTDLSRSLSLDGFANVVMVASSHSSVDPPVSAVARNDDPTSPGYVGAGYEYVYQESSDAITTTDQAGALARQILAERTALAESLSVTVRCNPGLDPLDLATVSRAKTGAAGTYQIQSLAWSDDPLMTVEMAERRVFL